MRNDDALAAVRTVFRPQPCVTHMPLRKQPQVGHNYASFRVSATPTRLCLRRAVVLPTSARHHLQMMHLSALTSLAPVTPHAPLVDCDRSFNLMRARARSFDSWSAFHFGSLALVPPG